MSWDLAVSALHVFLEAAGLPRVHAERLLIDLLDRYRGERGWRGRGPLGPRRPSLRLRDCLNRKRSYFTFGIFHI